MAKKARFVSFKCDLKLSIYSFSLPLFFICMRYFHEDLYHAYEPLESLKLLKYNLPYLFYCFLPKILSIFFIFIVKFNTKGESNILNENKKIYHIMVEKKNRKKILLLIYIISLLEAIQKDGDSLLYYYGIYEPIDGKEIFIKGWLIEVKTCLIFFVPIFSYLILHTEIHRHHNLALLFGYIGAIIVNGCRFF